MNWGKNHNGTNPQKDPIAMFADLVGEVEKHGLLSSPAILASLIAVGRNSDDIRAREHLDFCLTIPRMAETFSPNPFLPLPEPGQVDGTFRFASVEGYEE